VEPLRRAGLSAAAATLVNSQLRYVSAKHVKCEFAFPKNLFWEHLMEIGIASV